MNQTTKVTWRRLRQLVKKRDNAICFHCGDIDENGHCDHLQPISKGGTDSIMNLVWSCANCNLSKGNSLLDNNEYDIENIYQDEIDTNDEYSLSEIINNIFYTILQIVIKPYPKYTKTRFLNLYRYAEHICFMYSCSALLKALRHCFYPIPEDAEYLIRLMKELDYWKELARISKNKKAKDKVNHSCPICKSDIEVRYINEVEFSYVCKRDKKHSGYGATMVTDRTVEWMRRSSIHEYVRLRTG